MRNWFAAAFAVLLFLCLSGAGGTQDSSPPASPVAAPQTSEQAKEPSPTDARTDAEQLFQLATELKAAVDKSNENVLSLQVVRRAEAVEKLAHELRQKIKDHPAGAAKP